jgi:Domain of unknown function (DUF4167)
MRQGQQKRMRGRNRGTGGKGPNPLSRSYESNGPDVKVRGTAAHIAEKYVQLARDAQSSGDPILAEAYLQHAEHYFRVIAAAQPQFSLQQPFGQAQEDEEDGEDFEFDGPIPSMPQVQGGQQGQHGDEQPRFQPQPRDRNFDRHNDRQSFGDRPPYQERPPYGERGDGERPQGGFRERYPSDRGPRDSRPFEGQGGGARNEGDGEGDRGFNPRQNRRDRRFDRPFQDRQGQDRQGQDRQGQDRQGQDRQGQERPGQDRQGDRQDRQPFQERGEQRGERPQQIERPYSSQPVIPVDQPQPDISDDAALNALPSFITGGGAPAAPAAAEGEGEARFPLRSRRRRAPKRVAGSEEGGEPTTSEPGVEPVTE